MRVMICDDEKNAIEYLKTLLRNKPDIEINGVFQEQETFLNQLSKDVLPDIVFMDIDWKDKQSGIILAKKVNELYP